MLNVKVHFWCSHILEQTKILNFNVCLVAFQYLIKLAGAEAIILCLSLLRNGGTSTLVDIDTKLCRLGGIADTCQI